jgi:signal transduction histidine kinase
MALIIRSIYLYRIAQLRKIHEAHEAFTQKLFESQEAFSRQLIESQESERKRIAVELHDAIGQSLIVIRNRALMGLSASDKQDRLIAQMEEISESAAETITEVRRISQNLHPYQIEHLGLTTAIETMIENADQSSPIEFDKEIDNIDEIFSKESEINLYRIVQESINNILKHSEATKAKITIKKSNEILNILIEDDGKGFNGQNLSLMKGGLGLTGIGERAKMLNAKHEILSVQGEGTRVSLQIILLQNNE